MQKLADISLFESLKVGESDGARYILPLETDGTVQTKQSQRAARHLRSALRLVSEQSESGFRELAGAVHRIAKDFQNIDWNDDVYKTELGNWQ